MPHADTKAQIGLVGNSLPFRSLVEGKINDSFVKCEYLINNLRAIIVRNVISYSYNFPP